MRRITAVLAIALSVAAQAATVNIKVNADGSFTPNSVTIQSGDTVEWSLNGAGDSIIPINWDGKSSGY